MSTTAFAPINNRVNRIVQKEKDTQQIAKEEIKHAKKLEELETKYKAGEISEFEYKASKFLLSITPKKVKPANKFSTTA